ncbi:MAG: hypothetical protein ACKVP7_15360 [Hyphomicrobiaceae bacterium]
MSATTGTARIERSEPRGNGEAVGRRLVELVLLRIAASPADAGAIARDTWRLASATLSADQWAHDVDAIVERLAADALIERHLDRSYHATARGAAQARQFLATKSEKALAGGWAAVRDGALLLRALGLDAAPAKRQKAVAKVDGLRLALVVSAWDLKLKGAPTPSRARTALALVALARAFGNSVKGALGAKTDLSPKASRLLAAQLSKTPKDYGTDARLIAALAAEAAGVAKSDLAALRLGAIRRFISDQEAPKQTQKAERRKRKGALPLSEMEPNSRDNVEAAVVPLAASPVAEVPVSVAPTRPDPARFAAAVNAAAASRAEGWAGNRKAFVSAVWDVVREQYRDWRLSEIEFKSMLTEAHRTGLIVLANADLKDKRYMTEIQASAISYKNTVWHYIRVEG